MVILWWVGEHSRRCIVWREGGSNVSCGKSNQMWEGWRTWYDPDKCLNTLQHQGEHYWPVIQAGCSRFFGKGTVMGGTLQSEQRSVSAPLLPFLKNQQPNLKNSLAICWVFFVFCFFLSQIENCDGSCGWTSSEFSTPPMPTIVRVNVIQNLRTGLPNNCQHCTSLDLYQYTCHTNMDFIYLCF